MTSREAHIFIVWSKGLHKRNEILEDIETKFEILECIDVTWTKNKFSENLSRFYGENLPKNSSKEEHCGTDIFLCIIIRDNNPKYELRETSKGIKAVNSNMFDAKQLYRQWTGGGHKIHGSDNISEAKNNMYLLFGIKYNSIIDSDNTTKAWAHNKDLIGANGWDSLEQIFEAFNELSNYVVLRNFANLDQELNNLHPDIDLLTDNKRLLVDISNGKRTSKDKKRVQHLVLVKNQKVFFDFRYLGDDYYDNKWEQHILNTRVKYQNLYIPNTINHFYSIMYHAFIHKPDLMEDYVFKLIDLSKNVDLIYENKSFIEFEVLNDLNRFMTTNNYKYVEPRDLSVYFNTKVIERFGDIWPSKERASIENIWVLKKLIKKALLKIGIKLGK
ncbi:hypothetical protein [uncultured Maribacter sp.]|uniref:hypothetical protein n=1 Tax=uncultured Maribacter sp. TaxID=431308 RepID=UPI0030EB9BF0|tara:strand:+ start:77449 stop:78609 length:1161 start_codon:yes stop_codon:yes gene_type:complete